MDTIAKRVTILYMENKCLMLSTYAYYLPIITLGMLWLAADHHGLNLCLQSRNTLYHQRFGKTLDKWQRAVVAAPVVLLVTLWEPIDI